MKNVHEDVERPLVDAGPADGETDLGHCCPQGLLGEVRLCDCHLNSKYSSGNNQSVSNLKIKSPSEG